MDRSTLKALALAGAAAGTAGLLWYLFRDSENEEDEAPDPSGEDHVWFKVTDPQGCAIGVRAGPSVQAPRTGQSIYPGEVFPVQQIMPSPDGSGQTYLLLADGRGWAFTHSGRDGRLLAEQISREQAEAEKSAPAGSMADMMRECHALLEQNPALREQILNSEAVQGVMNDPAQLQAAAEANASVAQALSQNPNVQRAVASDPEAFGAALRAAAAGKP
eukprot:TRINITY_DN56186_c0_g1_i1.p1 TRINITY_DN56186_c0_g1~~TRINITY_DN56186_c0_g1_i1.p1  ORF type:complete len:218 (-),score=55.88 TRINITY_DN56186_c0_g1_i1:36-689(-)